MHTLDHADDFDSAHGTRALLRIAAFAKTHDGVRAHVTRTGRVLLSNRSGEIRSVRTMRALCEWLGY